MHCNGCEKELHRFEDEYYTSRDTTGEIVKWCCDCYDDSGYSYCAFCGHYARRVDACGLPVSSEHRGDRICRWCIDSVQYTCELCQLTTPQYTWTFGDRRATLTRKCDCYTNCPNCAGRVLPSSVFEDESCVECSEDTINTKPWDYRAGTFISHTKTPDPEYRKSKLLFGLELEVHTGAKLDPRTVMTKVGESYPYFYYVHDGSVMPGFEMVTHPHSFTAWQDSPIWESINTITKEIDHSVNEAHEACGIHIHMTKAAFSRGHVAKLLHFIYSNKPFMEIVSGRNFDEVCNRGRSYCRNDTNDIYSKALSKSWNDKYTIVNLQNPATIELRCFKSVVKIARIKGMIEFCHALFTWTQCLDYNDAWNQALFCEYVSANRDTYPNLDRFLKENI